MVTMLCISFVIEHILHVWYHGECVVRKALLHLHRLPLFLIRLGRFYL